MNKKNILSALFMLLLSSLTQDIFAQAAGVKPELIMYRHNSAPSGNSPTPILNGNILGTLRWNGLTAIGAVRTGASIQSTTKVVSPGVLRANMVFSTSTSNTAPWEPNQRMIITEDGLVGIGTMTPQYHLDVVGNTHTSGRFYGRIHFDNFSTSNDAPSTYTDEAYFERRMRSVLTVPAAAGVNDFGGILSLAPGGGAYDHQLFFGQDGIWNRRETENAASWTEPWEKLLSSADIKGTPNRIARFLPPNNPSSKLGDSQLFDDGTNVGIGTVTPNPAFLLTVGGDTRFNGNVHSTGNATIDGNATVGGATTTNSLAVTNNAAAGSLNVTNNTTTGSLNVTTDATVNNNCRVNNRLIVGNPPSAPGSYSLYVNGSAIAEEVVVKLQPSWPDYVFETNYDLKPLSEVEQYIQENKHLPGMVSAKEVAAEGLNLGQTQTAQMEKIEELYLHMIDMDKQLKALQAENVALKTKVEQLAKQ